MNLRDFYFWKCLKIQYKRKSTHTLRKKFRSAEPRLGVKMTNTSCCFSFKRPQTIWRSSDLHQKLKKRQLTLHADVCSCWLQSRRFNLSPAGMGIMNCSKLDTRFKKKKKKSLRRQRQVYLEELELERERWRLRPGDLERERRRAGDRLLGDRDLSREKIWTYW